MVTVAKVPSVILKRTMKLGEGTRRLGEACWSHGQCIRFDDNSFCDVLKCRCETGFHNIEGRCSRNYWEDLGLENWELLLMALFMTILVLAIIIGCFYYSIITIIRLAKRHRKTLPTGDPPPTDSFGDKALDTHNNKKSKGLFTHHKLFNGTIKRGPTTIIKPPLKQQQQQHAISIHQRTQDIVEKEAIKHKTREEERREAEDERLRREMEERYACLDHVVFRPTKFILPLELNNRHHHRSRYPYFDRSISFSTDVPPTFQPRGVGGGMVKTGGFESSSFSHRSSRVSWSSMASETGSSEQETDWYYVPPRRQQFRTPVHRDDLVGKSGRPLLLRASTYSESDESI